MIIPAATMFEMTDEQFLLVYYVLSFFLASMLASTRFTWMLKSILK